MMIKESVTMIFPIEIRMDRVRRRSAGLMGLVVAAGTGLAGCGWPGSGSLPAFTVYEVKGKVLLGDGKPLKAGWVYFVPKGDLSVTPSGQIGPDGTFSVVTGGSGEGAPPGDYKLRIEAPQFRASRNQKPLIPQKYTDEDSSKLVVTVRAESNQLEPIRLK
jgi:hypothetical protein